MQSTSKTNLHQSSLREQEVHSKQEITRNALQNHTQTSMASIEKQNINNIVGSSIDVYLTRLRENTYSLLVPPRIIPLSAVIADFAESSEFSCTNPYPLLFPYSSKATLHDRTGPYSLKRSSSSDPPIQSSKFFNMDS